MGEFDKKPTVTVGHIQVDLEELLKNIEPWEPEERWGTWNPNEQVNISVPFTAVNEETGEQVDFEEAGKALYEYYKSYIEQKKKGA